MLRNLLLLIGIGCMVTSLGLEGMAVVNKEVLWDRKS